MGRRSNKPMHRSLLGSQFSAARDRVDYLCHQAAAAMVHADFDKFDAVRWLFSLDTRQKLTAAYPLAPSNYSAMSYTVPTAEHGKVWIGFKDPDIQMLVPHDKMVDPDVTAYQPLLDVMDTLWEIHRDHALVKHVLEWMDTRATLGAMRYYWPSVASLAPNFELGNCPVSYQEPYGIDSMVPLLRKTAQTIAQDLMIPKRGLNNRGLSIPIGGEEITVMGEKFFAGPMDFYL